MSSNSQWHWLALAGGSAAAALAIASLGTGLMGTASAEASAAAQSSQEATLKQLREWLIAQGADLDAIDIKPSKVAGEYAGFGLYVAPHAKPASGAGKRWWWPFGGASMVTLAQFPLASAITAGNILKDPQLGHGYGWMLTHGVVDERTIMMAHMAVERAKGEASVLAPWINALPSTFHTPLYFSEAELQELRGTTLYRAAKAVRTRLEDQWEKMQPALTTIVEEGAKSAPPQRRGGRLPTFEDLLWAHSVFWSRGQALPVPQSGPASKLLAKDHSTQLQVVDAIVPGLDFANHAVSGPQCWWEVVVPEPPKQGAKGNAADAAAPASGSSSADRAMVQLQLHSGKKAAAGEELFISYGDKSNEELLMLYGFAEQNNPNDTVMLACPIPPSTSWDDIMHARMDVMQACELRPQFFLRASDLKPLPKGAARSGAYASVVPQEALDSLEVFVLNFKELGERMRLIRAHQQKEAGEGTAVAERPEASIPLLSLQEVDRRKASMGKLELRTHAQRLGLRMGALTTFVRLLEVRVVELEGEQGTGSLEEDETLLAQGPGSMPHRKWACVVYRAGQKRITRQFLAAARAELQDAIRVLQEMEDLNKKFRASS